MSEFYTKGNRPGATNTEAVKALQDATNISWSNTENQSTTDRDILPFYDSRIIPERQG